MDGGWTWEAGIGWATAVALAGVLGSACADGKGTTFGSGDVEERSAALAAPCRDHDGVRVTTGSTGRIEISDFFVGATFYTDDTILRTERCVAHLESPDEARAPAGTLTVGSDLVGTLGGPAAPLVINPDARNARSNTAVGRSGLSCNCAPQRAFVAV